MLLSYWTWIKQYFLRPMFVFLFTSSNIFKGNMKLLYWNLNFEALFPYSILHHQTILRILFHFRGCWFDPRHNWACQWTIFYSFYTIYNRFIPFGVCRMDITKTSSFHAWNVRSFQHLLGRQPHGLHGRPLSPARTRKVWTCRLSKSRREKYISSILHLSLFISSWHWNQW